MSKLKNRTYVVNTRTLNDYSEVVKYIINDGGMWAGSGEHDLKRQYWSAYGSETCLVIKNGCMQYESKNYGIEQGHNILTMDEFRRSMEIKRKIDISKLKPTDFLKGIVMSKFDDIDIVINVPTIEDWIEVVEYYMDKGLRLSWDNEHIDTDTHEDLHRNGISCIHIVDGVIKYDLMWYYKLKGHNILPIEYFSLEVFKHKELLKDFK